MLQEDRKIPKDSEKKWNSTTKKKVHMLQEYHYDEDGQKWSRDSNWEN